MLIRPRVFLACLAIFLLPLLLVAGFSYWSARRLSNRQADFDVQIAHYSHNVSRLLEQQEAELVRLAQSQSLLRLIKSHTSSRQATVSDSLPLDLRNELSEVLHPKTHLSALACFTQPKRELFFAERRSNELVIREKDFMPGQLQPDERSWTAAAPIRSLATLSSLRASLQITVPVRDEEAEIASGLLVGEVELDSLLREAATVTNVGATIRTGAKPHEVLVTDDTGRILYHPNPAFLHQQTSSVIPRENWTAPARIGELNLFVAAIGTPAKTFSSTQAGVGMVLLSLVLASVAALVLAAFWEKRASGRETANEGVAPIDRGDLHRVESRSSDALRPPSDNQNLTTAQLREQIARETEARQFQSFIRLSAMLTHDLKNAIEALSLIVSNMERHFDNEAFRVDAMKSLNIATQNLRALVDRLTNPVTTLSGEYKRPQPVDLVVLIDRVIKLTAEPALSKHQIETKLPDALPALVDAERIERVIENLILNAVEAMSGEEGKLSIAAGEAGEGKVFFSVTDNGVGISREFIENQLFHPFATTKRRGVGLGLYTCREVVRANGGSIEVVSREGAGTTFRVVLPSAEIETV